MESRLKKVSQTLNVTCEWKHLKHVLPPHGIRKRHSVKSCASRTVRHMVGPLGQHSESVGYHIYIYIYTHTCVYIYIYIYIQVCVYIYIHMWVCIYIYICIHIYIYIYIYIYATAIHSDFWGETQIYDSHRRYLTRYRVALLFLVFHLSRLLRSCLDSAGQYSTNCYLKRTVQHQTFVPEGCSIPSGVVSAFWRRFTERKGPFKVPVGRIYCNILYHILWYYII